MRGERKVCPWCRNGPRRWFTSTNGPTRAIACVVCGANGTVGCEVLLPPTLNDVLVCTACGCSLLGAQATLFLADGLVHLECLTDCALCGAETEGGLCPECQEAVSA